MECYILQMTSCDPTSAILAWGGSEESSPWLGVNASVETWHAVHCIALRVSQCFCSLQWGWRTGGEERAHSVTDGWAGVGSMQQTLSPDSGYWCKLPVSRRLAYLWKFVKTRHRKPGKCLIVFSCLCLQKLGKNLPLIQANIAQFWKLTGI